MAFAAVANCVNLRFLGFEETLSENVGNTVCITDPSLFVVQTPKKRGDQTLTWTSTWHGPATHCPGLEESFP